MLYLRPKFSCPASSGTTTSSKNWDRAFLNEQDFVIKYGHTPDKNSASEDYRAAQ
jgi:hypothetical protein